MLLQLDDLHVAFHTRHGTVEALHGITLALQPGQTLGLVGESGSGKSVTALAIMRLLDRAGRITRGRITLNGTDVTAARPAALRRLRGPVLSMIFQNPRAALNPIRTVGQQITDVLQAHQRITPAAARARALHLLDAVRIHDPASRLAAYPAELSGGMCQRVMIAMAIACQPSLLIADEPTTGLDVTTQKTVMDLLATITRDLGMATILITHDLGLAAQACSRIAVMEHGHIVEHGPTETLFRTPTHPYTRRLIAASPTRTSTLASLQPASPATTPTRPVTVGLDPAIHAAPTAQAPTAALLTVQNLQKSFGTTKAVDGVSFTIPAAGSLGLVGESGSGKTTLSRLVARLIDPDAGTIAFQGQDIATQPASRFHRSPLRRAIQIVFQDPHDSLDPRHTAFDSIAHPIRRLERLRGGTTLTARVHEAAARAGLPLPLLTRYPHQLSGGQKARVGIARAIAPRPALLILDEPTAALDVSIQATILQLLDGLRRRDGLALLFVSHDLNVVRMMCDDLVVLRHGTVVESGRSQDLFANPQTPYTRLLLDSIPHFDPTPEPVPA